MNMIRLRIKQLMNWTDQNTNGRPAFSDSQETSDTDRNTSNGDQNSWAGVSEGEKDGGRSGYTCCVRKNEK